MSEPSAHPPASRNPDTSLGEDHPSAPDQGAPAAAEDEVPHAGSEADGGEATASGEAPRRRLWLSALLWLATAMTVLIVAPLGFLGGTLWSLSLALPAYEGRLAAPGLNGPVEITFDQDAVPFLKARGLDDAAFALGWLHARERLWQMEQMRRVGQGRLAEVLPLPMAERIDRFMRVMGFYRRAEADYEALPRPVRHTLDRYAAGVNYYLATAREPLPIEFKLLFHEPEPWRPADSLVWGKLMALQLSGNHEDEIRRVALERAFGPERARELLRRYPDDAPLTFDDAEEARAAPPAGAPQPPALAGTPALDWARLLAALPPALGPASASNVWVAAGSQTETGAPLLASDPHLGLTAPVLWYLARIETPELTLTGATVPGVPFLILGHNGHIAWGLTTTGTDVQDLVIETLAEDDQDRYLTPGGSEAFVTRTEIIRRRFDEPLTLTVRESRHGPILSDIDEEAAAAVGPGRVAALRFVALDPEDGSSAALWQLNRARDWKGFTNALRLWVAPQQNVAYADTAGNIGMYVPGRVPLRAVGTGLVPVEGAGLAQLWTGHVPFEELPHAFNPPRGRIANANNRLVGPDYPHRLTEDGWEHPYRAMRLEALLERSRPYTLEGFRQIQTDPQTLDWPEYRPLLGRLPAPADPVAAAARTLLLGWDGAMLRHRPEPLIFAAWRQELSGAVWADELRAEGLVDQIWPDTVVLSRLLTAHPHWCDDIGSAGTVEACDTVAAAAFERAVAAIARRWGPEVGGWRWGAAHRAPLEHALLARLPLVGGLAEIGTEMDGGLYTLLRAAFRRRGEAPVFDVVHGAGLRAVYDLGDLSRSGFMIATGQSGNPFSPHYGGFVARWAEGALRPLVPPAPEQVLGTLVLEP